MARAAGSASSVSPSAPTSDVATGTQIRNVAQVTFNLNSPIATDQVDDEDPSQGIDPTKQALITIDSGPPTSSIGPLPPEETSTSFTVTWSGQDDPGGSGIAFYDIYASDDGGPYTALAVRHHADLGHLHRSCRSHLPLLQRGHRQRRQPAVHSHLGPGHDHGDADAHAHPDPDAHTHPDPTPTPTPLRPDTHSDPDTHADSDPRPRR